MRWRVPLVVVLAFFVAVSCDQQPIGPDTDQVAEAPVFNFTKNPDAGPKIFRGDDLEWAVFWMDFKRGRSAVVGIDVKEFCLGNVDLALVDFQDVYPPRDDVRIVEVLHGDDLPASAWPFTYWDCGRFLTEKPLAEGYVDMRSTDNDLNTYLYPDTRNKNPWGFRVHGAFSGHANCVWDGYDEDTIKCTEVIIAK